MTIELSAVDQLVSELRDQIYEGTLLPGAYIPESSCSKSQGTARHALVVLEGLNLVVRSPRRGTHVVNPTKAEIRQRMQVRVELETLVSEDALRRLKGSPDHGAIRAHLLTIGQDAKADERFHHAIWDLAENRLAIDALKRLSAPMFAFVSLLRRKGLQRVGARAAAHHQFLEDLLSPVGHSKRGGVRDLVCGHLSDAYRGFLDSRFEDLGSLAQTDTQAEGAMVLADGGTLFSMQREFLSWLPGHAAIREPSGRLVYSNGRQAGATTNTEGFVGQALTTDVTEDATGERSPVLKVSRFEGRQEMTIWFPLMAEGRPLVGEVRMDVTRLLDVAVKPPPSRAAHPLPERLSLAADGLSPLLAHEFFEKIPAVATWKAPQGTLLWANVEYERVTGLSRAEAVGRTALEIFRSGVGATIAEHDRAVLAARRPHLTTNVLECRGRRSYRATWRFPATRGEAGTPTAIGTLGFDQEFFLLCDALLRNLPQNEHRCVRLSGVLAVVS